MKKAIALLLCVLVVCFTALPVQATSGIFAKDIEDALTFWNRPDLGYSTQVVVGTLGKALDFEKAMYQVRAFEIERCVYGNVKEMALMVEKPDMGTYNPLLKDRIYLLITHLVPIEYKFPDGKERNVYSVMGTYHQSTFWFKDGKLQGYDQKLVDEILTDAPGIDTMDELAEYFEKRIDALQREGKLAPDPVDWPGLLCAVGGLVLLSGATAVLVWKRRKAARV